MFCRRNPLNQEQRQQMAEQVTNLRETLGLTHAQFGALLTQLDQGGMESKKKYWIGLKYYPAYLKRWEKSSPSWSFLVIMKKLADAHGIPFNLPVEAAPHRLQHTLPPGEYYQPEEKLMLADIPDPIPLLESGRAFAPTKKIRRYKPQKSPNPALMSSLTDMGLDYSCNPNPWVRVGDVWIEARETPHVVTRGHGAPYRGRSKRYNIVATYPDGTKKTIVRDSKTIRGGLEWATKIIQEGSKRNPDEADRKHDRDARRLGDEASQARVLVDRIRRGDINRMRVAMSSLLGNKIAQLVVPEAENLTQHFLTLNEAYHDALPLLSAAEGLELLQFMRNLPPFPGLYSLVFMEEFLDAQLEIASVAAQTGQEVLDTTVWSAREYLKILDGEMLTREELVDTDSPVYAHHRMVKRSVIAKLAELLLR